MTNDDLKDRIEHAIKQVGNTRVEVRVWGLALAALVLVTAILL